MVDDRGITLPAAKRQKPDPYVVSSNDALTFKLLDSERGSDLLVGHEFRPEFTHQVFGEEEEIKGYQNLRVDVYFSPHTFKSYLSVAYDKKQIGCDNILRKIQENVSENIVSTKQEFQATLREDPPFSVGDLGQPLATAPAADGSTVSIYQSDVKNGPLHIKVKTPSRGQPLLVHLGQPLATAPAICVYQTEGFPYLCTPDRCKE